MLKLKPTKFSHLYTYCKYCIIHYAYIYKRQRSRVFFTIHMLCEQFYGATFLFINIREHIYTIHIDHITKILTILSV